MVAVHVRPSGQRINIENLNSTTGKVDFLVCIIFYTMKYRMRTSWWSMWLRLCLPMYGASVWSWSGNKGPTCRGVKPKNKNNKIQNVFCIKGPLKYLSKNNTLLEVKHHFSKYKKCKTMWIFINYNSINWKVMTKLGNKKSFFRHFLNNSKRNWNLMLGYITHDDKRNTRYQNLCDV